MGYGMSATWDQWSSIADAVEYIAAGKAERLDGAGYKVYRAGSIIRIDITAEFVAAQS
jgi:hypothetical protein